MRSKAFYPLALILALLASRPEPAPAAESQNDGQGEHCYRIGVPAGIGATHVFMDITTRVFSSAHLCVIALRLPQIRLNGMIEGDELDGAALPGPIDKDLWGLVLAVPTPLVHFTGMLYWPGGKAEPNGAATNLGYILGQQWAHDEAARRGAGTIEVRDNRQLFDMAENGRLQGFLLPKETISHFRGDYPALAGFQSRQIADLPILLLVLPRHKALLPTLDGSIRALQKNGTVDKLIKDYAP